MGVDLIPDGFAGEPRGWNALFRSGFAQGGEIAIADLDAIDDVPERRIFGEG
jgi:hypothetical protein